MDVAQTNLRVLLADGNADRCRILSDQIQNQGLGVEVWTSGTQIMDFLLADKEKSCKSLNCDLVILTIDEPKLVTEQVLNALKHATGDEPPPVLIIIPNLEDERVEEYLDLGVEECITFPMSPALLKKRIEDCLERVLAREQSKRREKLLKYERDMQIGRQIQIDFLPSSLPQPQGWEIASRFQPARQVAGDFFDAFPLTGDKVALVIADVCDKGIGPALFMALSRSLLRAFAEQHRPLGWMGDLGEAGGFGGLRRGGGAESKRRRTLLSAGTSALLAVELTNNYIAINHGGMAMFASLFFGVLDPSSGLFTYINGGHDAPIIVTADGTVKSRLMPTGSVIGIMPNLNYDIKQVVIEPGEVIFMFTDGVTDALSPCGERFSQERLISLLKPAETSTAELLDRVEAALQDHISSAEQFDDITMLVARRVG